MNKNKELAEYSLNYDHMYIIDTLPVNHVNNLNRILDVINKNQIENIENQQAINDGYISSLVNSSEFISTQIIKHHESTSNVIGTSLSKVTNAISSIPDGSYPLAFTSGALGAVVAAFAAFLLNYLYWKKVNTHNRLSHFATVSIEHLDRFENSTVCYWISNKNNANSENMMKLEIRIRTQYSVLKSSLTELTTRIPARHIRDITQINQFISDVFDDATGGNFESSSKKRDRKLALKLSRKCLELKSLLIRYSQKMNE